MIRVVLDEDLDVRLRHHFGAGFAVETVEFRGWKGLRNGDLLRAMIASGSVDAFVTADRKLPSQQNLTRLSFGVLVLRPVQQRLPALVALMPAVRAALERLRPGEMAEIAPPNDS